MIEGPVVATSESRRPRTGTDRFLLPSLLLLLISPMPGMTGEDPPTTTEKPQKATSRLLIRAHAHNDYLHERPLLDALDHGFCSVEADVFLVDERLLVAHERSQLKTERTLEALYLDPLLERVRENGGRVFPRGPDFTLLVDFKSAAEETYIALDRVLAGYEEMLTVVEHGVVEKRAVTVIISGNRAWERISADSKRYAGVDGRLSDLGSNRTSHLMPLISDNWERNFTWRGQGPMPDSERAELLGIVEETHAKERRVRFWATPDRASPARSALWSELLAAGVDLIGTDDLSGLKMFLLSASGTGGRNSDSHQGQRDLLDRPSTANRLDRGEAAARPARRARPAPG